MIFCQSRGTGTESTKKNFVVQGRCEENIRSEDLLLWIKSHFVLILTNMVSSCFLWTIKQYCNIFINLSLIPFQFPEFLYLRLICATMISSVQNHRMKKKSFLSRSRNYGICVTCDVSKRQKISYLLSFLCLFHDWNANRWMVQRKSISPSSVGLYHKKKSPELGKKTR